MTAFYQHVAVVCLSLVRMDGQRPANVVFFNVANSYTVTWQEGVTCYFRVDPSILPGVRHIVGIFPTDWKSTKEYVVCDWSPMPKDYQPDQPLDNYIHFSGEYQMVMTLAKLVNKLSKLFIKAVEALIFLSIN